MNSSSLFTRVLWVGAVGVSLVSGLFAVLFGTLVADSIRQGETWATSVVPGVWDQPLVMLLFVLGVAGLNTALWSRLLRRRAAFQRPDDNSFMPRSKYAVWSPVLRASNRIALRDAKKRKQSIT